LAKSRATKLAAVVLRPSARCYRLRLARLGAPRKGLRNWGKLGR